MSHECIPTSKILIDEEFRTLIPPLSPEEREGLTESLIKDGLRYPILIWNDTIVDGHNRYEICRENHIDFKVDYISFTSRNEAKIWIIRNQLFERRNLSLTSKCVLALKMEPMLAQQARERQAEGGKTKAVQNTGEPARNRKTEEKLAKIAGCSHDTLYRVKIIMEKAPETMKQKLMYGDAKVSINSVYEEIRKAAKIDRRIQEVAKKSSEYREEDSVALHHADFLKDYTILQENSVDAIITDPPYVKEWINNWEALAKAAAYVLKPSGFLIMYVPHAHADVVMTTMTKHLSWRWPAVMMHTGNSSIIFTVNVCVRHKPIWIFQKQPTSPAPRQFNDVFKGSGKEKDLHEWQQSEEELAPIIEAFTEPNDVILDPLMGSGTTIVAARNLKRKAIGFDIDASAITKTKARLAGLVRENVHQHQVAL